MLDFIKEVLAKMFMILTIITIGAISGVSVAIVLKVFGLPTLLGIAFPLIVAIMWEAGERLILRLRMRRMRKEGKKNAKC